MRIFMQVNEDYRLVTADEGLFGPLFRKSVVEKFDKTLEFLSNSFLLLEQAPSNRQTISSYLT
jgi:hypothetical protein